MKLTKYQEKQKDFFDSNGILRLFFNMEQSDQKIVLDLPEGLYNCKDLEYSTLIGDTIQIGTGQVLQ